MSTTITFSGAKGGQGTTTVAAAAAVFAGAHRTTTLVTEAVAETATLLGLPRQPAIEPIRVMPTLWLSTEPVEGTEVAVCDTEAAIGQEATRFLVVRGPCYLALARLLDRPGPTPDGIVLLVERGRTLSARDVAEVTGIPVVATVPVSDAVARSIDAGLLLTRLHRLPDLAPLRPLVTPSATPPGTHQLRPDPTRSRQTPHRSSPTGTDLPGPQSGPGGEGGTRVKTRREPVPSMHVYGAWTVSPAVPGAEHRQARPRCRRLLPRRGGDIRRGLLHGPGRVPGSVGRLPGHPPRTHWHC